MSDTEDPNIATLREYIAVATSPERFACRGPSAAKAATALSALASTLAERDRRIAALEANEAEWRDLAEGLSDSLAAANAPAPDARRKRTNHVAVLHAFITSHFALNSFPAIAAALRALDAAEKCEECDGSGERYDDEDNPRPCIDCSGTGRIEAEHLRAPKGELEEARAEAERLRERLHVIIDAWKRHAGGDLSDEEFSGSIAEAAYQEDRAALSRARGEGT